MQKLILCFAIFMSGCSATSVRSSPGHTPVDFCMDEPQSRQYWTSHFSKRFEGEVNAVDPSGASILISAAINGRLGKVESAREISRFVLQQTGGSDLINFAQIKKAVDAFGYSASGAFGAIRQIGNHRKVMAISTDLSYKLLLISGVENGVIYTIYPGGQVCGMSADLFKTEFGAQPMILINAVSI